MEKIYDAPELRLIGEASEVVMGGGGLPIEANGITAPDFEFEQDEL